MRTINIIAAVSRNGVIGKNGTIPWKLKGEQIQFKELTTGNAVIMGRATYEDIGHPLPGRINIVVSRTKLFEDIQTGNTSLVHAYSLIDAIRMVPKEMDVYIAGGQSVYEQAMHIGVDRMYITEVDMEVEKDGTTKVFPEIYEDGFDKIIGETVEEGCGYTRTVYTHKSSVWKFRDYDDMHLQWEDVKSRDIDIKKIRAKLPGNIGHVTLLHRKFKSVPNGLMMLHYQINPSYAGSGIKGMMHLPDEINEFDVAKKKVEWFLAELLERRKNGLEQELESVSRGLAAYNTER